MIAGGLMLGAASSGALASDMITLYMQGFAGTGSERLSLGVVAAGPGEKRTVLFAFPPPGVAGGLEDPKLTVRSSTGEVVGSNDNWRDSPDAAEIGNVIAATGINISDRAAAIILPLAAGSYAAQVEGANGTTGIVAAGVADLEDDHRGGGGASNVGPCGGAEVELSLVSTGVIGGAKGKARVRNYADCGQDFRVEIEDVPVGTYGLIVGGVDRGAFQVVNTGIENEGQIEFDDEPNDAHERPLTFDPTGQLIEVTRNGEVVLDIDFPAL